MTNLDAKVFGVMFGAIAFLIMIPLTIELGGIFPIGWLVPVLLAAIALDSLDQGSDRARYHFRLIDRVVGMLSPTRRAIRRRAREKQELIDHMTTVRSEMFSHEEGTPMREAFRSQLDQLQIVLDHWESGKKNKRVSTITNKTNDIINRELGISDEQLSIRGSEDL